MGNEGDLVDQQTFIAITHYPFYLLADIDNTIDITILVIADKQLASGADRNTSRTAPGIAAILLLIVAEAGQEWAGSAFG